jgi:hypothetical protein
MPSIVLTQEDRDLLVNAGKIFGEALFAQKPVPAPPPPPAPSIPTSPTDSLKGDAEADDAPEITRLLRQHGCLTLPSGKIYAIRSKLVIPDGATLRSDNGAVLLCQDPKPSSRFVELGNDTRLSRLAIACQSAPVGGTSAVVFAMNKRRIQFDDVIVGAAGANQMTVHAHMTGMTLWGCMDVIANRLIVRESCGNAYGIEIIGGYRMTFRDSLFLRNGADGVKVMGNADYGVPTHLRFLNCVSQFNGQSVLQKLGEVLDTPRELAPNRRYLVQFPAVGSIPLPPPVAVKELDTIVFVLGTDSKEVDIDFGGGMFRFAKPKMALQFTVMGGKWVQSWYGNGEGWDLSGVDIVLDGCVADGNEGAGFQVKPGPIPNSDTRDILFVNSLAKNNGSNGFGVVRPTESTVIPIGIGYSHCVSEDNFDSGFSFTTGTIRDVRLADSVSRGNKGIGLYMQGGCRAFNIHDVHLQGNGELGGWNWALIAGKRHRASNVSLSGVDPRTAKTDADLDSKSNAKCQGLYVLGESGDEKLNDVKIEASFHNHKGPDVETYTTSGQKGLPGTNFTLVR